MRSQTKLKLKLYITSALLIFLVPGLFIMGARTVFDPGRLEVFNQSGLAVAAVQIWGVYTCVGALLMAHPRTFKLGCVLLLLNNFFIIGIYAKTGSMVRAALEALSMAIPISLLWVGHPYSQWKNRHSASDGQPEPGKSVER